MANMSSNDTWPSFFIFSNYSNSISNDFNTEYYYLYVHPVACLSAAIMNLICALVFANKELLSLGPFYQYSLANSIGSSLAMFLLAGYAFTRCNWLCNVSHSLQIQLYELYAIFYMCNAMYFFGSLIQIAISVQLYLSISQRFKQLNRISPVRVICVFFLVSYSLGLSIIFCFKLDRTDYLTITASDHTLIWTYSYRVRLDEASKNPIVFISLFYIIFSNNIFLIILIVVNLLLYVELRKILKRKMQLQNGSNRNQHATVNDQQPPNVNNNNNNNTPELEAGNLREVKTRNQEEHGNNTIDNSEESKRTALVMVLWVSLAFCSSRFIFAIANLVFLIEPYSFLNQWLGCLNTFYVSIVYFSYFFVYMRTNKHFNRKFNQIFLRKHSVANLG